METAIGPSPNVGAMAIATKPTLGSYLSLTRLPE